MGRIRDRYHQKTESKNPTQVNEKTKQNQTAITNEIVQIS